MAKNCVKMLFFSLASAVFFYPFLHEFGHMVFAVFAGVKAAKINLLPLPYFAFETRGESAVQQAFIGVGGICFSYLFSMLLRPRKFWAWYVVFVLRLISVYSVILSLASVVFFGFGVTFKNDDISAVLSLYPNGIFLCGLLLFLMLLFAVFSIKKEKPFSRLFSYLYSS